MGNRNAQTRTNRLIEVIRMINERIDTSKYKGHTPGPWYAEEEEVEEGKAWTVRGGDHWVVMESDGCLRIDWKKEDALLAADAPEILAELKRCYAREDELLNEFQKMSAQIDGLRDILSLLEDRHDIDMSQFKNYFASE